MSSYNLACSITDISINWEDPIVFFPLIQSERLKDVHNLSSTLHPAGHFSGINALYTPFSLPVECEYNDFFKVTNVKPNLSTKYLEETFGFAAEDIINVILTESSIYDWRNKLQDFYLSENLLEIIKDYQRNQNLDNLLSLGFIKEGNRYLHKELPVLQIEEVDGHVVQIYDGINIRTTTNSISNILRIISLTFKKYLGLKESSFEPKLKLLENLSGMTIKKDIYDFLIKPDPHLSNEEGVDKYFTQYKAYLKQVEEESKSEYLDPMRIFNLNYISECYLINQMKRYIPDYQYFLDKLTEGGLEEQQYIKDFLIMKNNMYGLNKMFKPATTNSQFGETDYTLELISVMKKSLE